MTHINKMNLLRLFTGGNVDDGKSTLIGRLLYDSQSLYAEQRAILETDETSTFLTRLAHVTDGLKAEREQGITIDVAYRYFHNEERRFILADAPGHLEYTRNMATAASTADLGLLIVDAQKPIQEQTKRHAIISSLLAVPHLVVCINKMDLVNYNETVFNTRVQSLQNFLIKLNFKTLNFIPISALKGDGIVIRGNNMSWYKGETLLELLTHIKIIHDTPPAGRFPVQYVIQENTKSSHTSNSQAIERPVRHYAGSIASGTFTPHQKVTILPSGTQTTIEKIRLADKELTEAIYPMAVTLELKDNLDISRGSLIVSEEALSDSKQDLTPALTTEFKARLCSFSEKPIQKENEYFLKQGSRTVRARIVDILSQTDINIFTEIKDTKVLKQNDVGQVTIQTDEPLFIDSYQTNRHNGRFILIDLFNHETAAAGMYL